MLDKEGTRVIEAALKAAGQTEDIQQPEALCGRMPEAEKLAAGLLSGHKRESFIRHIAQCRHCRDCVSMLSYIEGCMEVEAAVLELGRQAGAFLQLMLPERIQKTASALRGGGFGQDILTEVYTGAMEEEIRLQKLTEPSGKHTIRIYSSIRQPYLKVYNKENQLCFSCTDIEEASFEYVEECFITLNGGKTIHVKM